MIVVNFDLDVGPVIHAIYPTLELTPAESENMYVGFLLITQKKFIVPFADRDFFVKRAFSAFPDSLQFDQGSQAHSFRVRDNDASSRRPIRPITNPTSNDGFIYGYSYFTQRVDSTSKRGYQQVRKNV